MACASTGNAASSLAGAAASVGLQRVIFVPEFAPEPKVAQLLVFGARVIRVKGSYDETWELCQRACARYGWYNRNAAVNPSLVEGKKTCGLEIGEQIGDEVPDWVAVSVGDGCTIAGIWKGLVEMHALGLHAAACRGCWACRRRARGRWSMPSARAATLVPGRGATLADSICVGHPRNWRKALRAVRDSGGAFVAVPDDAILEAMREAGRRAGVFGEPAGVAGLAGLRQAVEEGIIGRRETRARGGDGQRPEGRAHGDARRGRAGDPAPRRRRLDAHLREQPLSIP